MFDNRHRAPRLSLSQRILTRVLRIKISDDGHRWTAPRRHRALVEDAFKAAAMEFWRDGVEADVSQTEDGVVLERGDGVVMELRWVD